MRRAQRMADSLGRLTLLRHRCGMRPRPRQFWVNASGSSANLGKHNTKMTIAQTKRVTLGERVCTVCKLGKSRGMTTKVLSLLPYSLIPRRLRVCTTEPADVVLLRRLTRVKRVRVHSSYGCFPQVRGGHTSYVGEIVLAEAHSCCTGEESVCFYRTVSTFIVRQHQQRKPRHCTCSEMKTGKRHLCA